jgi:kelch-like protein 17 (actinfilin)
MQGLNKIKVIYNLSRNSHEVVEAEGYLYAIGGGNGKSSFNTVERYDVQNNKWIYVKSMMLQRGGVGAAVIGCPNLENVATK